MPLVLLFCFVAQFLHNSTMIKKITHLFTIWELIRYRLWAWCKLKHFLIPPGYGSEIRTSCCRSSKNYKNKCDGTKENCLERGESRMQQWSKLFWCNGSQHMVTTTQSFQVVYHKGNESKEWLDDVFERLECVVVIDTFLYKQPVCNLRSC